MSKKFLYLFKEGHDAFGGDQTTMKNTLGGKGAGLAEMTHAGLVSDPHAADRVNGPTGPAQSHVDIEELAGRAQIPHVDRPDGSHPQCPCSGCLRDLGRGQRLPRCSVASDASGQVDRRAEHVAVAFDRGAVMHACANDRKSFHASAGPKEIDD